MKALDFVKTPRGNIAMVTETIRNGTSVSIVHLDRSSNVGWDCEKAAWWDESELTYI